MTNSIENVINKWLYEYGFDCHAKLGNDFYYNDIEEEITFGLLTTDKHDKLFRQVFIDNGLNYDCDIFVLSFFHELGHYNTLYLLSDNEVNVFTDFERTNEGYMKYYNLPREIIATKWAIDYINKNPNLVKEFWTKVQREIFSLYDILGFDV